MPAGSWYFLAVYLNMNISFYNQRKGHVFYDSFLIEFFLFEIGKCFITATSLNEFYILVIYILKYQRGVRARVAIF